MNNFFRIIGKINSDQKNIVVIWPVLKRRFSTESANELIIEYLKKTFAEYHRPGFTDYLVSQIPDYKKCRRSAVLVPISVSLVKNNKNNFVQKSFFTLSKRTEKVTSHKGDVCFVGGMCDSNDKNEIETAFREAKEEIGIEPKDLSFVAQMAPLVSKNRTLITPIVCYFNKDDYSPVLNSDEVEFIFDLPTERFISDFDHEHRSLKSKDYEYYVHYFKDNIDSRKITTWGITAVISVVVSSILHSRAPSFPMDPSFKLKNDNINEFMEHTLNTYNKLTLLSSEKLKIK